MRFVLGIVVALVMFGCGIMSLIFGFPDRYIKRDVQVSELVGTWNITAESKSRMQDAEPYTGLAIPYEYIKLNHDGTCKVDLENTRLSCSWELTKVPGLESKQVPGITLDFHEGDDYVPDTDYYLYLFEENDELILWTVIDDPDDFNLQEFKKSAK
jgi:hypothetical protein